MKQSAEWVRKRMESRKRGYAIPEEKQCTNCRKTKPADAFRKRRIPDASGEIRIYLNSYCVQCDAAVRMREYHANPQKNAASYRKSMLKQTYGLTEEKFAEILASQDGKCAICLRTPKAGKSLFVDHCHTTKQVRGLLCNTCNFGIGCLNDSTEMLRSAIRYLDSGNVHSFATPWCAKRQAKKTCVSG